MIFFLYHEYNTVICKSNPTIMLKLREENKNDKKNNDKMNN